MTVPGSVLIVPYNLACLPWSDLTTLLIVALSIQIHSKVSLGRWPNWTVRDLLLFGKGERNRIKSRSLCGDYLCGLSTEELGELSSGFRKENNRTLVE